jgi:hypothetical protein
MQEISLEISLVTFLAIMVEQQTILDLEPIQVIMKAITVELYSFLVLEHILDSFQMGTWVSLLSLGIMVVLETIRVIM